MNEDLKLNWLYSTHDGVIGLFDTILAVVHPQFHGEFISENLINYYQGLVKGHTQFCKLTGLLAQEELQAIDDIIDGWFDYARNECNRRAIERYTNGV